MNGQHLISAGVLWDYHNQPEPLIEADLIVGLGSYDLRVADRCVELYKQSYAAKICFTGASGNWTADLYSTSEAAAFEARAKEQGVPSEDIDIEEKARNIGENIALTRKKFADAQRIIWVTKPQTQRRVRASLDAQLVEVVSTVTAPEHGIDAQPTEFHSMHDLICELVGDTWRIAAYPELGFMVEQEMPEKVCEAYNVLVAAGFTEHLPDKIVTLEDR